MNSHRFDWQALLDLFPPADWMPQYELVPASQVPQPYHGLLVHEHHMTVTVEAYHRALVNVRVLEHRQEDEWYARKILLSLQGSGQVVMFGLVRIHLQYTSPAVRAAILERKTPLGRILIQHNVLRRIEPVAFVRLTPGSAMLNWFSLPAPVPCYGRFALIHCDEKPAVELLEIVAPE